MTPCTKTFKKSYITTPCQRSIDVSNTSVLLASKTEFYHIWVLIHCTLLLIENYPGKITNIGYSCITLIQEKGTYKQPVVSHLCRNLVYNVGGDPNIAMSLNITGLFQQLVCFCRASAARFICNWLKLAIVYSVQKRRENLPGSLKNGQ